MQIRGFAYVSSSIKNVKPIRRSFYFTSSPHRKKWKGRNINRLSFSCGFRHCLRAALPSDDLRCGGNLGFSESPIFTDFAITRPNILSSVRSTGSHESCFDAYEMLSYHSPIEIGESASSVLCFSPGKFSAPASSNSELLHTL